MDVVTHLRRNIGASKDGGEYEPEGAGQRIYRRGLWIPLLVRRDPRHDPQGDRRDQVGDEEG